METQGGRDGEEVWEIQHRSQTSHQGDGLRTKLHGEVFVHKQGNRLIS